MVPAVHAQIDKPRYRPSRNTRTEVEDSRPNRERTRGQAEAAAVAQALVDDFDALLDEIDSVLEENAEEFVQNYVQKTGE